MAPFGYKFGDKTKGLVNAFSNFTPTEPSARLSKTFGEVQAFKRQVVKAETLLKAFAKTTDDLLKTVDETVTAFPRIWSRADDGVGAVLQEEDLHKADPAKHKLSSYPSLGLTRTLDSDMKEEVFNSIDIWHGKYKVIKERIDEVEKTRLDYNKARQKVNDAHKAAVKIHAKKDSTNIEENPGVIAANAVLTEKREAYIKIEETVHVELAVVVMDSQNSLEFLTRALALCSRALADAAALHQQESIKLLPAVMTESSGRLQLGPSSPTAGPLLLDAAPASAETAAK